MYVWRIITFTWFLFLINGNPGKLKYRGRVLYDKAMNRTPYSCIVRIIMASVFEISKALFVLWFGFGAFQFLKFAFLVIHKYKHEYDKQTGKHDENVIGGVKRKDWCWICYYGPGNTLQFMDKNVIFSKRCTL